MVNTGRSYYEKTCFSKHFIFQNIVHAVTLIIYICSNLQINNITCINIIYVSLVPFKKFKLKNIYTLIYLLIMSHINI